MAKHQSDIKKPDSWADINKNDKIEDLVHDSTWTTPGMKEVYRKMEGSIKKHRPATIKRLTNLYYVSERTIGPINDHAEDNKPEENASFKGNYQMQP